VFIIVAFRGGGACSHNFITRDDQEEREVKKNPLFSVRDHGIPLAQTTCIWRKNWAHQIVWYCTHLRWPRYSAGFSYGRWPLGKTEQEHERSVSEHESHRQSEGNCPRSKSNLTPQGVTNNNPFSVRFYDYLATILVLSRGHLREKWTA
jgi:hypothetical protein